MVTVGTGIGGGIVVGGPAAPGRARVRRRDRPRDRRARRARVRLRQPGVLGAGRQRQRPRPDRSRARGRAPRGPLARARRRPGERSRAATSREAAQDGDAEAVAILAEVGRRLGRGDGGAREHPGPGRDRGGGRRRRRSATCCWSRPGARSRTPWRRRSTAPRSRSWRPLSAMMPARSARRRWPWTSGRHEARHHPAAVQRPAPARRSTPRGEAEALGYDGVFVFDHFFPPGAPSDQPALEAFTMLAAVAEATERVRIGTLVTRASLRPAGLIAKMASVIDAQSGGRLILGDGDGRPDRRARARGASGFPRWGSRIAGPTCGRLSKP